MDVIEKMYTKVDECGDATCYMIGFLGMEALLQLSVVPGSYGGDNERARFHRNFHKYVDFVNKNLECN